MKITKVEALEKIANRVRIDILQEVYYGKSGHIGGSLSIADILTVLYFNEMNVDEEKPNDYGRDRLVLSKGHCVPALYAVLAEKGYFPKEDLVTLRNINGHFEGHPSMETNGIDMTTGSLGQGLSVANGMALASKMDKSGNRVYCILGDGEMEEGQVWEAMMTSSKYNLDNLCVIVDCNSLQLTDTVENIKNYNYESLEQRFRSFGFNTDIINGNNIEEIMESLSKAELVKGKPTVIIAKTIKGKGVSFMENKVEWHGKAPNDDEYKKAVEELVSNMINDD